MSQKSFSVIYTYIYIYGDVGGAKGARGLGRQLSGKGAIWRFVALGELDTKIFTACACEYESQVSPASQEIKMFVWL